MLRAVRSSQLECLDLLVHREQLPEDRVLVKDKIGLLSRGVVNKQVDLVEAHHPVEEEEEVKADPLFNEPILLREKTDR
jgi:hypothetical protein